MLAATSITVEVYCESAKGLSAKSLLHVATLAGSNILT